jgi:aminoglycoside phosphotransferase (APT) family kinase protein
VRTFVATPESLIVKELSASVGRAVRVERIGGYLGRSEVFAVPGERAVLKVYHDNAAIKRRREADALGLLQNSGLPVPGLLSEGSFSDGELWVLMTFLPGDVMESCEGMIAQPEMAALFAAMGEMLASVHSIPVAQSVDPEAPADPLDNPGRRYAAYRAHVTAAGADNAIFGEAAARMVDLERELAPLERRAFVHRDFCRRNILVRRDAANAWEVSGLIDFERSRPGDPMEDIALLAFKEFLDAPELQRAFIDAYASKHGLPEDAGDRLAYHLLGLFFEIAKWARLDDPEYYGRSLRALERLLEGDPAFSVSRG